MDVDIQASLPGLKKQGRLHGLRKITVLGRITYAKLIFEGDNTVKNQVIERYLTAEAEAQQDQPAALAVTPANYKFQYKGQNQVDGRTIHIFQVTPKHKKQGMFKGEVWIDAATYLPIQESGYLIKSPSIFVKKVAFVRKFEIRDGVAVPRQVQSTVDTRLFGKAELTVDFTNFSLDDGDGDTDNR
jgi:negative regulator of sigma E activity